MAYITKEEVQAKRAKLKEINKKYGVKATFSGAGSSTLKLTITAGKIDFISNAVNVLKESTHRVLFGKERVIEGMINSGCITVNQYYLSEQFSGVALEYLQEVYALMQEGHWDESDIQSDYFNCSWYNRIQIGKWDKGYELI